MEHLQHSSITENIIKAFYRTYKCLGYGFLEKVYERSLVIELRKLGLSVEEQCPLDVWYDGICVGTYYADLLVERKVIVEIKAASLICDEHEAQLLNYLRASEMEIGLFLNYGKTPEFRRRAFSNHRKHSMIE